MTQLQIRGAREHNLRGVDLDLPPRALVALVGVSGAGKSSLLLDTLLAEGRRRYLDALAGGEGGLASPDVDWVGGLPPAVSLGERVLDPRERLGDVIGVLPLVEALFGRLGAQRCLACGQVSRAMGVDQVVDEVARSPEGARLFLEAPVRLGAGGAAAVLPEVARAGFSRVRADGEVLRVEEVRGQVRSLRVVVDRVVWRQDKRSRLEEAVRLASTTGEGSLVVVAEGAERAFTTGPRCPACGLERPVLEPGLLSPRTGEGGCPSCGGTGAVAGEPCVLCGGTGLSASARAVLLGATGLSELLTVALSDLPDALSQIPDGPVSRPVREELSRRVAVAEGLGLGALPLGRRVSELSGGQVQLARLARLGGAPLEGVLYLLDEPTAGLGEVEALAVLDLLRSWVLAGSGVIVGTHRLSVVRAADWVVEFGPGAGARGGRVIFEGSAEALAVAPTPTGDWLRGTLRPGPPASRPIRRRVEVAGLGLGVGALVAITGGMGAGKSRLLALAEAAAAGAGLSPRSWASAGAGRTSRSMPATYSGVWTHLRQLLAASHEASVRGLSASDFSLNTPGGRCELCRGLGVVKVELGVLPPVWRRCEACGGRRFTRELRSVRWRGWSADELLERTVDELLAVSGAYPRIAEPLRALSELGLGYLPLGQPGHTLSGGEARRLALARELATGGGEGRVYLLDQPETGLHQVDIIGLIAALHRLVDGGASVWVATRSEALVASADQVVALG
ncbi:MAG: hypothetical protein JXX28_17620 [Deltaproteobacteria bacterium]|nr:hypothetical protein [Deltaproteobacteria bacterium]